MNITTAQFWMQVSGIFCFRKEVTRPFSKVSKCRQLLSLSLGLIIDNKGMDFIKEFHLLPWILINCSLSAQTLSHICLYGYCLPSCISFYMWDNIRNDQIIAWQVFLIRYEYHWIETWQWHIGPLYFILQRLEMTFALI